jgi:hypothetical protein
MTRVELSAAELARVRQRHHESALLYLTDRCPVGCEHCSVAALPATRSLDLALLGRLLDGLCAVPGLRVVGISGGEPCVERRGLTLAVDRLRAAGREVVLYTSGVWAGGRAVPYWLDRVLRQAAHVVLSTDVFHLARLPGPRFVAAARAIRAAGAPLSVQVVRTDGAVAAARGLLREAFGPDWTGEAHLDVVPLLPYGRAAGTVPRPGAREGAWFGRCAVANSVTVRYDGMVVGCCNERILAGGGPAALRRSATTAAQTVTAIGQLGSDPHLRAVGRLGLGALTSLPGRADLATRRYADPCRLCWALVEREATAPSGERVATLLAMADALGLGP